MILLYGDKCQRKESRETITAGLERAFAGTNRVPEALGAIRAGLEGAGIESAVVLTERIGKIGFIDGLGNRGALATGGRSRSGSAPAYRWRHGLRSEPVERQRVGRHSANRL